MSKFPQSGITHIIVLIILTAGLLASLYLVQHPQIFKPKAFGSQSEIEFIDSGGNEISETTNPQVSLQVNYVPNTTTYASATSPSTDTGYDLGVLVLKYFPTTSDGRIDTAYTGDVGQSYSLISQRVETITNSLMNFLPKATSYLNSEAPSLNYHIAANIEHRSPVPFNPSNRAPLYDQIMSEHNICNLVDGPDGVREVWLFAYQGGVYPGSNPPAPYLSISESLMSGPNGTVQNGGYTPMPICSHTYRVYTFNYYWGADQAIHSWSHQMESELGAVDYGLFWNLWVGGAAAEPGNTPGSFARCGWTHKPPNARGDYDYENPAPQNSDCPNWQPLGGTYTKVSCADWSCVGKAGVDPYYETPALDYYVWMWQHLPGRNNDKVFNNQKLRNWWDVHGDWDNIMSPNGLKSLTLSGSVPAPVAAPTATAFRVANSLAELGSATEQPYFPGKIIGWTLPPGTGTKTVYAEFKVNGFWISLVSNTINLSSPTQETSPSASPTQYSDLPTPNPTVPNPTVIIGTPCSVNLAANGTTGTLRIPTAPIDVNLSWTSTGDSDGVLQADGHWGPGNVSSPGTDVVSPQSAGVFTYNLTCSSSQGTNTTSVTVVVGSEPASFLPPPTTCSPIQKLCPETNQCVWLWESCSSEKFAPAPPNAPAVSACNVILMANGAPTSYITRDVPAKIELTWTSSGDSDNILHTYGDWGPGEVTPNGSTMVFPQSEINTYSLDCENSAGKNTSTVTVNAKSRQ